MVRGRKISLIRARLIVHNAHFGVSLHDCMSYESTAFMGYAWMHLEDGFGSTWGVYTIRMQPGWRMVHTGRAPLFLLIPQRSRYFSFVLS